MPAVKRALARRAAVLKPAQAKPIPATGAKPSKQDQTSICTAAKALLLSTNSSASTSVCGAGHSRSAWSCAQYTGCAPSGSGTRCACCDLDLGERYGEVAAGFIHVHHLAPLAGAGGEYTVDPIKDLRPVCPNCHAVMHLRVPPLTIEAVKEQLRVE